VRVCQFRHARMPAKGGKFKCLNLEIRNNLKIKKFKNYFEYSNIRASDLQKFKALNF